MYDKRLFQMKIDVTVKSMSFKRLNDIMYVSLAESSMHGKSRDTVNQGPVNRGIIVYITKSQHNEEVKWHFYSISI